MNGACLHSCTDNLDLPLAASYMGPSWSRWPCKTDKNLQVGLLRAALGANAVPCPQADIGNSFTSIAKAALGIDGFYPYDNDVNFLLGEPFSLGILLPFFMPC